ncbi:MAG: hypothetical protein NDJ89_04415 [Oligoflexia bacterium]|nr:hypothetical protein [Oligoflexia bacterium]
MVNEVTGKSRRQCDELLASLAPEAPRPERARPISATHTEIRFTADQALLAKLEKLKGLLSHRNPNPSYAELIELLAEIALGKLDPERKPKRKPQPDTELKLQQKQKPEQKLEQKSELKPEPRKEVQALSPPATPPAELPSTPLQRSRYLPSALRRAVWKRDQGRCTYVNEKSGLRCDSQHLLKIHHLHEFSRGGPHSLENTTLRCRSHNAFAAIQTFGTELMGRYLRS